MCNQQQVRFFFFTLILDIQWHKAFILYHTNSESDGGKPHELFIEMVKISLDFIQKNLKHRALNLLITDIDVDLLRSLSLLVQKDTMPTWKRNHQKVPIRCNFNVDVSWTIDKRPKQEHKKTSWIQQRQLFVYCWKKYLNLNRWALM